MRLLFRPTLYPVGRVILFQYFFISQKLDEIGCNASHLAYSESTQNPFFSVAEEKIVLICSSSIFLDIEPLKFSAVFENSWRTK